MTTEDENEGEAEGNNDQTSLNNSSIISEDEEISVDSNMFEPL